MWKGTNKLVKCRKSQVAECLRLGPVTLGNVQIVANYIGFGVNGGLSDLSSGDIVGECSVIIPSLALIYKPTGAPSPHSLTKVNR